MAFGVVSNITEFSDDILLNIFSYLSSWDLLNTLDACQRFNKVGRDKSLWKEGDFSESSLTATQIIRKVVSCLHSGTKRLNFKGQKRKCISQNKWKTDLLSVSVMKSIGKRCPHLQELYISEAIVDAKKFKLNNFTEVGDLKVLSIVDCEFVNLPIRESEGSYFRNMHTILSKLEYLEISKSNWINDYDFMALSKLDSLKKLILKSDLRIGFTMVYLSLSFRFGFKNLEELDLRGTSLQNNDVQSILQSGKLKDLSIGPIGRVRRLTHECDRGFNLVMSDPQRRDEPKQQVVVINMGPNGPDWHTANDDELHEMGLQWLRNGLNKNENIPEEEHYFFRKGSKFGDSGIGECSKSSENCPRREACNQSSRSSKKRKVDNNENSDDPQSKHLKTKCTDDTDPNSDNCDDEDADPPFYETLPKSEECNLPDDEDADPPVYETLPKTEECNLPDEFLSDRMIDSFENHSFNLHRLRLSGCAISNDGLIRLVKSVPWLKYLDVTHTLVTSRGVQESQLLVPECSIISSTDSSR